MQSNTRDAKLDRDEPLALKKPSTFEDIATSIGSRNLMIIIITMPLVFLAVVSGIIAVFGDDDAVETAAAPASVSVERLAEPAPTARATGAVSISAQAGAIGVAPGADITAMSLDGDRLALRIDGPDGVTIVIYDIAAGAVVQRIPVTQTPSN